MSGGSRIPVIAGAAVMVAVVVLVACIMMFGVGRQSEAPRTRRTGASPAPPIETHLVDDNHWIVSRLEKEEYLKDLSEVTRHILIKPNPGEKKDTVTHLTIIRLSEDSPMHAAGFRKDDVILQVNGTPIGTMGRAINLVHEVKRSDDLTVQVKRGEETIDYRFEFR